MIKEIKHTEKKTSKLVKYIIIIFLLVNELSNILTFGDELVRKLLSKTHLRIALLQPNNHMVKIQTKLSNRKLMANGIPQYGKSI